MKSVVALLLPLTLLLTASTASAQNTPGATSAKPASAAAPVFVQMKTTLGDVTLQLDPTRAPLTVANFVGYANEHFYDGLVFHRVIPGFMAQGGGYDTQLKERSGHAPIKLEADNGLQNRRGTIAMARTNIPNSATSEFFVNLVDNARLDGTPDRYGYAVFGRVVQGLDVIDRIASIPTGAAGPFESDVPQQAVVITQVRVVDAPAAAR